MIPGYKSMDNLPKTMKALCYVEPGKIELRIKPVPTPGLNEALLKITCTTICGSDVHIWRGELPIPRGTTVGHEPVGIVVAMGANVRSVELGDRVVTGAISPCGLCNSCQSGSTSQCGGKPMGGWRIGNVMDGSQAEYMLVPDAEYNLAKIPAHLSDIQVVMCPDVMSTGFSGPELSGVKIGDTVAVFAQGPIGLSSTVASRLLGATKVIGVSSAPIRLETAKKMGCDHIVNYKECDPVEEIMKLTNQRGVDVAIEACGIQTTFENCLKVLRPGGHMGNLGFYSKDLTLPLGAYCAGVGDKQIFCSLCPGGKNRMERLMNVLSSGRADFTCLVTHKFSLDDILSAYDTFSKQRESCIKVAIFPGGIPEQ